MPTSRPDGLDPGEVARMLAGSVERLADPVKVDDLDALRAELEGRGKRRISRNIAELLGIPLDDPAVESAEA